MDLRLLDPFANDHHGLVTRAAANNAGVSAAAWYRAISAGRLQQVHPGVVRMYGAPVTREQVIAAAVLAAGAGALASHRSAAHMWGLPRPDDDPVDIIVTSRQRGIAVAGALVHRPRDHRDLTPVLRQGVRTTNILRTLCDLGVTDRSAVNDAVGHVITTGMASPAALHRAVQTHSRRGRAGVPALREALEDWVLDGKPADSLLEPTMRRLIRSYRLPPVEFHPRVGGYEIDFRFVDSPLLLECDGWGPHVLNRRTWEADKARDADLAALGFITTRFTYRGITVHARRQAQRLRRLLERWAPHLLGVPVLTN